MILYIDIDQTKRPLSSFGFKTGISIHRYMYVYRALFNKY